MAEKNKNRQDENVPLVGREQEVTMLQNLLSTKESELVAAFGRRRVGKSFLIKKAYHREIIFSLIGTQNAPKKEQLENFIDKINELSSTKSQQSKPKSWKDAFKILRTFITEHKSQDKKVIFFDELPWLASPKSGFLQAFDYFWNSWAVDQNLIIVICGSAASWMIDNVINDTGGLHNRVTKKIHLQPFTLLETEQYLKSKKVKLNRYEIVQLYMTLGGIPFYLREVQPGKSVPFEIDRICFGLSAPLFGEFDNLYKALFKNHESCVNVIKALAKKKKGITRNELVRTLKSNSGGGLTKILKELEESSFISSYRPFGKVERETLYRLTDEFSFFYLTNIEKNKNNQGSWLLQVNTPTYNTWVGYSFESVCLKNILSIKRALNIAGVYSEHSSYFYPGSPSLASMQIDLIIDRNDRVINICEMKFYKNNYVITKKDTENIKEKLANFIQLTKTTKRLIYTLISANGINKNQYNYIIDESLTLEHLFA